MVLLLLLVLILMVIKVKGRLFVFSHEVGLLSMLFARVGCVLGQALEVDHFFEVGLVVGGLASIVVLIRCHISWSHGGHLSAKLGT